MSMNVAVDCIIRTDWLIWRRDFSWFLYDIKVTLYVGFFMNLRVTGWKDGGGGGGVDFYTVKWPYVWIQW